MTDGVGNPGTCAQLACLLEASTPKAGNVHPGRSFEDVDFLDFAVSAIAVREAMERAPENSLGDTILDAITRTRKLVSTNTNLGIVLLLAPLAAAYYEEDIRSGAAKRIDATTIGDAERVYRAIRLAEPAGLGRVEREDVASEPTRSLRDVMALASGRDRIAYQYTHAFGDVFEIGLPAFAPVGSDLTRLRIAIQTCHLKFLAAFPDTLIERKCGREEALVVSERAASVLEAGWPDTADSSLGYTELDDWLSESGDRHRRNPGTSADLTAAALFLAIRDGIIAFPLRL